MGTTLELYVEIRAEIRAIFFKGGTNHTLKSHFECIQSASISVPALAGLNIKVCIRSLNQDLKAVFLNSNNLKMCGFQLQAASVEKHCFKTSMHRNNKDGYNVSTPMSLYCFVFGYN